MEIKDITRIAAFVPTYQAGEGQGVDVYFRDGSQGFYRITLRSFIRQIAKAFMMNTSEARIRYGALMSKKNLVPLVLSPFFIYVPLKIRKPLIPGDPAYGYFRFRSVIGLSSAIPTCTILLEGGTNMPLFLSYRVACGHMRAARKLEAIVLEQFYEVMDSSMPKIFLPVYGCTVLGSNKKAES